MTEGKTFKRRVRERMSKTGERYTAARKQVAAKRDRNTVARERSAGNDDRPSEDKLIEATGKRWEEWFSILDRWGARDRTHTEIARHLTGDRGLPGWWAQAVTLWYERARGMRLKHQRAGGGYEVTATKTIAVPVEVLYDSFVDDVERRKWFPEAVMSPRTATRTKGARFDWEDGSSRVVAWFETKGPSKSTISVAHEKLPGPGEAEEMKAMWRERLSDLKALLES